MDPNQSAATAASSQENIPLTPEAQAQDIQQPATQYQQSAATATSSHPADEQVQSAPATTESATGKNWLEYAGLQKVVDQLPQRVRNLVPTSVEQFNKLSNTQKIAGAVALAGLGYLALRSGKGKPAEKAARNAPDAWTGRYAGASGSYGFTADTAGEGQRASSSRPAESRRLDQGPGWWNNNSNGPDDDPTQTRDARNASYNAPSTYDSYSRGQSSRNRRDEEYRTTTRNTAASRDADGDFGSGI